MSLVIGYVFGFVDHSVIAEPKKVVECGVNQIATYDEVVAFQYLVKLTFVIYFECLLKGVRKPDLIQGGKRRFPESIRPAQKAAIHKQTIIGVIECTESWKAVYSIFIFDPLKSIYIRLD